MGTNSKEYAAAYRAANRERINTQASAYYHRHREARRARGRTYRTRPEVRERDRAYYKERRRTNQEFLNQLKLEKGCAKCGYREAPEALDFHHLDPPKKEAQVKVFWGRDHILREVAKCVVLCCICHRRQHGRAAFRELEADGKIDMTRED